MNIFAIICLSFLVSTCILAVTVNEQVNILDHQSEEKEQIFNKPEAVAYSDKDIPNEASDYEKINASDDDNTKKESNVEDNKEAENDEKTNEEEEMENEGIRGVLQENYEQIDAHENHNRPEVMKDDEGTSKESDQEITTNNIDNLEEKSDEENNDQETGDEIKTEDDDDETEEVQADDEEKRHFHGRCISYRVRRGIWCYKCGCRLVWGPRVCRKKSYRLCRRVCYRKRICKYKWFRRRCYKIRTCPVKCKKLYGCKPTCGIRCYGRTFCHRRHG